MFKGAVILLFRLFKLVFLNKYCVKVDKFTSEANVVAKDVPFNVILGVLMPPVNVGLARGAFVPISAVIVVAKFGSLPNAVASSFKVSNVAGADATKLATAVFT